MSPIHRLVSEIWNRTEVVQEQVWDESLETVAVNLQKRPEEYSYYLGPKSQLYQTQAGQAL